jgi:NitT/TauT family transport system substrate-binding protein
MRITSIALCAILGLLSSIPANAQEKTHIRFTLDWKLQGIHSWYYLAEKKGYFANEGLDVAIDQGEGSAATVTRIMSGAFDAGFGDINAIIQNAAAHPGLAPVMVYMIYNSAPFAIATMKDGPIKTIKDLEGHSVGGAAGSGALALLPTLAKLNGIDKNQITITNMAPNLLEQMLATRQADAGATYNITTYMNFVTMHVDPEKDVRWFYFKDYGIDLYSNGVMVSPKFLKEKPEAVRGLVRAINHAILDVIKDPNEGITALAEHEPLLNRAIEMQRLQLAFRTLMNTAEVDEIGLGDVKDGKIKSSIDLVSQTFGLPRQPDPIEVFDRSFLPPKADRKANFPKS